MFKPIQRHLIKSVAGILAATALTTATQTVQAVTNTFNFNSITVGIGATATPTGSQITISGASLNAGDVVVFDGIVNDVPGSTGDAWGAVNLNAGGYLGVTGASLGVLCETGTASGNPWQLFLNGTGTSTTFGTPSADSKTNRLQITLICSTTGSTANMGYVVKIDQGLTGTFTGSLSGTNVTFSGNSIALSFGANAHSHQFLQVSPVISLATLTPSNQIVAVGQTATWTASIAAGYPINTSQLWYSNGVPIPGANSLTYTTPPVNSSYSNAQYYVVVTNLLTSGNVVTSTVATLTVHSTPGLYPMSFPDTTTTAGGGVITTTGVSISGQTLLAGDTLVFDGIVTPNGSQASDAWTSVCFNGGGYGGLFSANSLAVLVRLGSANNPSQLFVNGSGTTNPTTGPAPTNRVHVEFYPSANGSTTNMGWLVKIDQNLTGTFQPAVTGTNLTFTGNAIALSFGSSANSAFVTQDPQSPVSIFSGPTPASQIVAVGSPATVGVTVKGWSPAFQWRKNGAAISGATNRNYTLSSVGLGDNGDQFTVVVSNLLNSANVVTSSVAQVFVNVPNNEYWYPLADFTTWDTNLANWTTNNGVSETQFISGNNVTFDSLGANAGGSDVTISTNVNPNGVTININSGNSYQFNGSGTVSGSSLYVTGDGTGSLLIQTPNGMSFNSILIDPNNVVQLGYLGVNGVLSANYVTNNGTINFDNSGGTTSLTGTITGSGVINQSGPGTTVLSGTNSYYAIGTINAGSLSIATTPQPGPIVNNSEIQPSSAASFLLIPNPISGTGDFYFSGFQDTIITGSNTFTGNNQLFWSRVIVNNANALGDTNAGYTTISGADRFGGLYLSNNIVWTQPLAMQSRDNTGTAATSPHIANISGTNSVVSPITFSTFGAGGITGSEFNVEATTGLLTVSTAIANNTSANPSDLNLQGAGAGIWSGPLVDSSSGSNALNVIMRGTGTWTLSGANTYSGTTTVSSGKLYVTGQIASSNALSVLSGGTLVGNGGTIASPVTVASGGTLTMGGGGTGVDTMTGSLTLSAGSLTKAVVNKTAATSDLITGLASVTYGGTLQVSNVSGTLTTSDSFKLFNAASYSGAFSAITPAVPATGLAWNTSTLTTDGTLRIAVASVVNTSRTNITATVSGGSLNLAWPSDHTGWTLEVQTNPVTIGIGTNWVRVAGSSSTNTATIPLVSTNGSVFYRLVYP